MILTLAPMYSYANAQLVAEVSNFGALGCLPPQDPLKLKESLTFLNQNTINPFAVNLFCQPNGQFPNINLPKTVLDKFDLYRQELDLPLDPSSVTQSIVTRVDENLESQISLIKEFKVPIVIFTFGLPSKEILNDLKNHGIKLIASVTSVKEALICEEMGLDIIIAQGFEAGGHRTSLILPEYGDIGTFTLVQSIKKSVSIPLIAAGGITNGKAIRSVMSLGADGVSMGTLFLTSQECSTPPEHRKIIFNSTPLTKTVVSRYFTGRPARMIPNRYYDEMKQLYSELPGTDANVPWNLSVRDIFHKASKLNRSDLFIVWGGQSVGLLGGKPTLPASKILQDLEFEYSQCLE
ncbi:2-nitropropane dioxygenase [Globomyces pollinis-pini]|nr:2-nitropropane dioxygenase [Globomyces pollinis-pini]